MGGLAALWRDRDKRRAALASVLVHTLVLLAVVLWIERPQPVPLDSYLVIEVGTPELAETPEPAPAADAPAPDALQPQVASEAPGAPRVAPPSDEAAAAPEPVEASATPPAPEPEAETDQAPEESRASSEATPQPTEAPAPETEAAAPPTPEAPQDAAPPTPAPPSAPTAVAPQPRSESLPDVGAPPRPEIDAVRLEPRPLAEPLAIPPPGAAVEVAASRPVTIEAAAAVVEATPIPRPTIDTSLAEARPIPAPSARATTASARAIPAPEASASLAAAQAVPTPDAVASVATAQPVPAPQVTAAVAAPRTVPRPDAIASAGAARDVTVVPSVAVPVSTVVPVPTVRAVVRAPVAPGRDEPVASARSQPTDASPSEVAAPVPPGGNAATSGQPDAPEAAAADARGRAAGPDGSADPTGASEAPRPFSESRSRPVAVLIDNVAGYPQSGLGEASLVAEMPVEGGLTRLMGVYDRSDPATVGPIRSARDYFVELADDFDAVLVHVGGSPGALATIERLAYPNLDAFTRGDLFSRAADRSAPYNLYSGGRELRDAIARLSLDRQRTLQGTRYRPPSDAGVRSDVSVRFSGAYTSGFRYVPEFDRYRWVRDGADAVTASGEAVLVEAVLVARIEARPLPGDPAGRLYIPLATAEPGAATLLLRGRAVDGTWSTRDGVGPVFTTADGRDVDLRPFRTWVLFAPVGAEVRTR